MNWNKSEIDKYLGFHGESDGSGFIYTLSYPGGPLELCIYPEENRVQIYSREFSKYGDPCDPREALSSYVHCTTIKVDYSDGPDFGYIVASGSGGALCITKQENYHAFFFSMRQST